MPPNVCRRPSQSSLTAAAPRSDYCCQSSLCKPESTWFRFICRFFLENGQERKYLEWEIWPENRQNQNKVVIAAFPIEFHGVQNSKEATSLSAWPVHRLGLAETSFAARTCILWVVHKFSATRNSLKHINFCVGKKLWSFNSVLATDHSKMPSAIISPLLSCCGQCGPMRTIDFYRCILTQNWVWTIFQKLPASLQTVSEKLWPQVITFISSCLYN